MNFGYGSIDCCWSRIYADNNYLLTIVVGHIHGYCLTARAVMDDFGTLVVVRDWI